MLNITGILQQCWQLTKRECHRLATAPIYTFCMVLFPLLVIFFFTSLMQDGLPNNLPAGVVDLDKTPTTRALVRNLDSYQTTKIIGHYANLNEARRAIQRGEIYAKTNKTAGTADRRASASALSAEVTGAGVLHRKRAMPWMPVSRPRCHLLASGWHLSADRYGEN